MSPYLGSLGFGALPAILGSVGGDDAGSYDLLATEILTSSQSSVTFSGLSAYASTYQHLQVRWVSRCTDSATTRGIYSRLNSDSGSNYRGHYLLGNGSSVASGTLGTETRALTGTSAAALAASNAFGAGVIDLLDPFSSSKYSTFRTLSGLGSNRIDLHSALWMNTASVTSWEVLSELGNFVSGSRFSLIGIKAA